MGEKSEKVPGTIIDVSKDTTLQGLNGAIVINELQVPGKKRVLVKEYLNGLGSSVLIGKSFS